MGGNFRVAAHTWFIQKVLKGTMTVAMFRKALVALTAALAVAGTALADGTINATEGIGVALAFLAAYGVYRVPNADPTV